jgi:diguanylate cyclase (GGDEF)-like protein
MADDSDSYAAQEEIEGAPPAISTSELRKQRLEQTQTVNRYLYRQSQQLILMLLNAPDLQALLETLLVSMPRHFSFQVAELWLYDPEDVLAGLIKGGERYGHQLQLMQDSYRMQELYEMEPDIALVDATDSRMFEVLTHEHGIDYALLLPLQDGGRMIGSLHLGMQDGSLRLEQAEEDLLAHLAAVISACFKNAVNRQQISQLTLLDPLTQISNLRGFQKDIAREISRARRAAGPVTVLMMEIDEFDDLHEHYGQRRAQFVVKKVSQRIASDLRATDMLARLSPPRFAVLVPGAGEMLAQDVAQRMLADIESFAIDDGRGAVLQVTISIGMVTWQPQQYPAVDMPRLAVQMESVGSKALESAKSRGGNCVAQARLSTMIS